ncbi:hypothetical protein GW17_00025206 [Ensete ventricosum]|nr:hypothetical protein GW17_00025206 [Ensete ventricosum]
MDSSWFGEPYLMSSIHVHITRHGLVEETRNLHAATGSAGSVSQVVSVPPIASGSFPAMRNKSKLIPAPAPTSLPSPFVPHPETTPTEMTNLRGIILISFSQGLTYRSIPVCRHFVGTGTSPVAGGTHSAAVAARAVRGTSPPILLLLFLFFFLNVSQRGEKKSHGRRR